MKVGYRRVSSLDQNLDRQELVGVEKVFEDKASGKDTNRTALNEMIAFVRNGDQVVVHSIDRLARDLRDLQTIILQLNEKGVGIEFLSERLVFSGNNDDAFAKLDPFRTTSNISKFFCRKSNSSWCFSILSIIDSFNSSIFSICSSVYFIIIRKLIQY